MNRKVAVELMRVAKILLSTKKDEDAVDWWRKAFKWYNKKYPKRALPLKEIENGIKWGDLKLYVGKLGLTAIGGLYTQHYVDYYILKNAPISNPPNKRPQKPSGYDRWLEKQEDLRTARSLLSAQQKLTDEQIDEVKAEMVRNGVPVRFLKGGRSMNIETGELGKRGTNIMYHVVYWNFTRDTAKKIADWLGAKAVFSD